MTLASGGTLNTNLSAKLVIIIAEYWYIMRHEDKIKKSLFLFLSQKILSETGLLSIQYKC